MPSWADPFLAELENRMALYLTDADLPPNLDEAIRYALLGGGKRLRPLLTAASCLALGGTIEACYPAAAAAEMIHAFSLVHDDLPALDNDDLRRGRPTVHVAYGEAMAVLVGDGLMSLAFQVIAERAGDESLAGWLTLELARGTTAMISGQVLDTLGGFETGAPARDRLDAVHERKTGALITASCRMGALSGLVLRAVPTPSARLSPITRYGRAIGLMFQIKDDLLDVEQTTEHLGKRAGKDEDAGKLTYPLVAGVAASRAEVDRLKEEALEAIKPLGPAAEGLRTLCHMLADRTK